MVKYWDLDAEFSHLPLKTITFIDKIDVSTSSNMMYLL